MKSTTMGTKVTAETNDDIVKLFFEDTKKWDPITVNTQMSGI